MAASNDSEISNVVLSPVSTGITLTGLTGTVNMNRSTIDDGMTGIAIVGGTGDFVFGDVAIGNHTVAGISVSGGSSNVTFGTPQLAPPLTTEFAPSSITQAGIGSVVTINGGHTGSFVTNAGTTLTATNGTGLQFDNADGMASYNFDGDVILNGGDAGIDILGGSAGTFTFANADITSPTGPAIQIGASGDGASGGTANVTFAADSTITQANNAATVSVLGNHTGTLTHNGTINATNGTGLQFGEMATGADGNYNFNGTTALNGGDAGIDILGGSAGTFTFADTTIVSPTGTAFNIDGLGGTSMATVNYTGGGITQTNNVTAVNVRDHSTGTAIFDGNITTTNGDGLQFNNADGVYDFNGTTRLNGGDGGIDILNGSDGTFTFSQTNITNTAGGIGVNIVGGTAQTTLERGTITTGGNTGLNVDNTGLTTILQPTDITAINGAAVNILNTQVNVNLRNVISSDSPTEGIAINNTMAGSIFSIDGVARIINAAGNGINIANSQGTFAITNTDIDGTGGHGVNLTSNPNITSVTFSGGGIDGTPLDGIHVENTSGLTVNNLLFGFATPIAGDGVNYVSNDGIARDVTLTNNSSFSTGDITGRGIAVAQMGVGRVNAVVTGNTLSSTGQTFVTTDSGNVASLILQMDNNSWSTSAADFASDVLGSGSDSTIVTSLGGNSAFGRGMLFDRVTFDATGALLAGTQVQGFGTTTISASGDGLSFINPTGDLNITQVDINSFFGTGLEVFTKGLGTTFNLQVGNGASAPAGTIAAFGGPAMFLDPLSGSINVGTVSSTNSIVGGAPAANSSSTGDGIYVDAFSATRRNESRCAANHELRGSRCSTSWSSN